MKQPRPRRGVRGFTTTFQVLAIVAVTLLASGAYWVWCQKVADPREQGEALFYEDLEGDATLPYAADPQPSLARALSQVAGTDRIVMVVFGANWCADCLALDRMLQREQIKAKLDSLVEVVKVDVGNFDQNFTLAHQLGVSLARGIPVAVFLAADGQPIGATNDGELETASRYSSRQIMAFVAQAHSEREVVSPAMFYTQQHTEEDTP